MIFFASKLLVAAAAVAGIVMASPLDAETELVLCLPAFDGPCLGAQPGCCPGLFCGGIDDTDVSIIEPPLGVFFFEHLLSIAYSRRQICVPPGF